MGGSPVESDPHNLREIARLQRDLAEVFTEGRKERLELADYLDWRADEIEMRIARSERDSAVTNRTESGNRLLPAYQREDATSASRPKNRT